MAGAAIAGALLENPRSILVIKPSSLGDVVHTLPAVACVKKRLPDARLTWLVNPEWAPLLEGNPDIDEILHFPRRDFRGIGGLIRFFRWAGSLPKHDLVLDFQGLFRSGYMARKAGRERWGTSDSRELARLFHNHVVPVPPRAAPMHAVKRYLSLVDALGCDTAAPLVWTLPNAACPATLPDGYIVLHPYSRGAGKSLTPAQVAAFCKSLAPRTVVIAGRADEVAPVGENVLDLLNKTTLPELCTVLRDARFVVSVDSGPMHIAAATNPNILSIHTWSDPRKVGPFSPSAFVWKDGRVGEMGGFPDGEACPLNGLADWLSRHLETGR